MVLAPAALLTDRVGIYRPTRTSTGKGGHTNVWVVIGEAMGRATPTATRGEVVSGAAQTVVELAEIHLDTSLYDVRSQDRLTVGGKTYEVLQIGRIEGIVATVTARRVEA